MGKVYQLVRFESNDECAESRTCTLLKKLGISYDTEESVRERVGSALLQRWYVVTVWIALSDIPKLEEALHDE